MVGATHLTHIMIAATSMLTIIGAGGCAAPRVIDDSPIAADASIDTPPINFDQPGDTNLRGTRATDLAAQAEQDVSEFLAQQQVQATPPRPGPRPIQWTGANAPREAPLTKDHSNDSPMATLGRPDDVAKDLVDAVVGASSSSPTAADVLKVEPVDALLVRLRRELYQQSAYADMPVRELLAIAAMSLVQPERELVVDHIPGLTDREREVLSEFQQFFSAMGRKLDGNNDLDEVVDTALSGLRSSLHQVPELKISATALCYEVKGFGDFSPFDRPSFLANTEQGVVIYMEIENFTSELNDHKQWVTELAQQLVIYSDRDGIPVWRAEWQPAVDISRNRRKDFFTVQVITLPTALGVGRYNLKLRVRDEKSRAETEHSVMFEMVADPNLAARIP